MFLETGFLQSEVLFAETRFLKCMLDGATPHRTLDTIGTWTIGQVKRLFKRFRLSVWVAPG
jgi:hypothetical protein